MSMLTRMPPLLIRQIVDMVELTSQERLQPSLLDRLTDEEPAKSIESRQDRVFSAGRLREVVLRDLAWLLNCTNFAAVQDLSNYRDVEGSILNYGIPDLTGRTVSSMNSVEIAQLLRKAIADFEPRVLSNSIRVRVSTNHDQFSANALTFEIEGELWAQPVPERLYLRTEVDLENGNVAITG